MSLVAYEASSGEEESDGEQQQGGVVVHLIFTLTRTALLVSYDAEDARPKKAESPINPAVGRVLMTQSKSKRFLRYTVYSHLIISEQRRTHNIALWDLEAAVIGIDSSVTYAIQYSRQCFVPVNPDLGH